MAENMDNNGLINNGDGITFKYVSNLIETTYFAVSYGIQNAINDRPLYRKNFVTKFFECLLDYIHIIPFLVHRFQYGEVSLAWARFCRWVQLQLPILTYSPFFIAFWVSVVAVAVILGLLIFAGVGFWYKYSYQKAAVKIVAFCLTTGYIFYFCHGSVTGETNKICSTACFSGSNLIAIIIGTMSTICLLGLAYYSAFVKSSVEPIDNNLSITTGVFFKTQYYFTIVFMTINRFWISPAIGVDSFGSWWEALFNLIALTWLFGTLVYLLPYQMPGGNKMTGAIILSLWWISCISFMSINVAANPDQIDRQLDYILIAGLLPFMILGEYIVTYRYSYLVTLSTSLIEEIRVQKEAKAKNAAKAAELAAASGAKLAAIAAKREKDAKAKEAKDGKDSKDAKGVKKDATKDAKKTGTKVDAAKEESDNIQKAQKAALLSLKVNDDDDKRRNTRLYLPKLLQDYQAGTTTIDIVGRLLWHHTEDKASLEAAAQLYESAEKAFPEIPYIKVLRASYFTSNSVDPSVHLPKIDAIKKMEPGLLSRYYVYKRAVDIRDRAKVSTVADGENALDLVAYIEFQSLFAETKKFNNRAIDAIREFWMLFLQKNITSAAFNRAARNIEFHSSKAVSVYKAMLTKFPKNPQVLTSYAYFLDLVLRNTDEAQRCIRRADEQKAREAEEARNGNVAGQIDSQAVVAITEDASIDQVNKALLNIYGYTRNELLGRNIKLLVPSPWKEKHDGILARYRATGIAKVIGIPQTLYGHHKEGYSFSMKLLVQERRKENGERNFIGMIQLTNQDAKNGIIIISEYGNVRMVTKRTLSLFGDYKAAEVLNKKNVLMLMPDQFAAGHDGYLKRYRDTGEARVIGTAGRNVPGKRKDGSTFPAALTVEELFADGERYFLAVIQDTSATQGTIFIDGFGTIQNSDLGIQVLLGYKKESIIGKNIKGIMPPPYCDYHDMYLERFRRTKVSNILRSVEGRILPAVHADGSVIQVRAIITRADSGEANSGASQTMLFKGTIKRGDLGGQGGTNSRKGYMADYELEMNKAGIITKLNRKVLTMLGHPIDRQVTDFIGQPIEVLVPAIPDKPAQQKSNWLPRALKSSDLNFYLIMVNKNYSLLPVAYCLVEQNDGSIQMRVRDLSELDALLQIDEVGNVLTLNDDAFMLLGNEPDEVIGRNIKYIQPPEVAENHDGYLLRYKETKVARVVGIARTVDAMHRDGSYFPIEIQVTEQIASDNSKSFIGRLRHRKIEERVEKDLIARYFVKSGNQLGLTAASSAGSRMDQSAMSMGSENSKRINFKGKKASSKGSKAGSNRMGETTGYQYDNDDDARSQLSSSLNGSGSQGNSSATSNTKFITLLGKLRTIKNSTKEDPSTASLGWMLNFVFASYAIFFIIGLIVTNVLQSPAPYYTLMQLLLDTNVIMNEVVFGGRVLLFSLNVSNVGSYCRWSTNTTGTVGYIPNGDPRTSLVLCPWINASYMSRSPYVTTSNPNHTTIYPVAKLLQGMVKEVVSATETLKEEYAKIRKAGDTFDNLIQGQYSLIQFVNGTSYAPTTFTVRTYWNLMAMIDDSAAVVALNQDIGPNTIRDWAFLNGNRFNFNTAVSSLTKLIPGQATTAINNMMIFHFVMALISIGLGVCVFFFLLVPKIRQIQLDREKILRLLLLMPKSSVYELVHRVYTTSDSEDDEEAEEEDDGLDDQSENEERLDDDTTEAQEITVIADRSIGIYLIFALGLALLTVPPIAHAIYRYVDDQKKFSTVTLISNLTDIYLAILQLSWIPFCGYLKCTDTTFCFSPQVIAYNYVYDSATKLQTMYNTALTNMQGNADVEAIFFQSGCTSSHYEMMKRCILEDSDYFPPMYFEKTHNGYSNLITNVIKSTQRFAIDLNTTGQLSSATSDDYWFLHEVLLNEAESGGYAAYTAAVNTLANALSSARVAANATYAVSLAASFVIFFWLFASVRKSIQTETKYNRAVLYIVPHEVLRNTKPIIEYIDQLHAEIGGT